MKYLLFSLLILLGGNAMAGKEIGAVIGNYTDDETFSVSKIHLPPSWKMTVLEQTHKIGEVVKPHSNFKISFFCPEDIDLSPAVLLQQFNESPEQVNHVMLESASGKKSALILAPIKDFLKYGYSFVGSAENVIVQSKYHTPYEPFIDYYRLINKSGPINHFAGIPKS